MQAILFSGGEPFSHPEALKIGLNACSFSSKYAIIGTSAAWARSRTQAEHFLNRFHPIGALWFSTDTFHEEFVPLKQLRLGVEVAAERGIDIFFQVVDDPAHPDFMSRFEEIIGFDLVARDQVYLTPLGKVGRARELDGADLIKLRGHSLCEVPDMPCPWLGAPWIHEDSVVCACPNLEVHQTATHPLRIGDLRTDDFERVSKAADADWFLQALRVYGPRSIVALFSDIEDSWPEEQLHGTSICDLCHAVARKPRFADRVREKIANAPRLQGEIGMLRLLLYGELRHRC